MKILIPVSDHTYRVIIVEKKKVVYNTKYLYYSEYVGDEYLESDEIVVEMDVAE